MSHDPALKPAVPRSVVPNCQFRSKTSRLKTFTANQLDEIKDPSGLFYILPFQKVRSKVQGAGPPGVRVLAPPPGSGCWAVGRDTLALSPQGYLVNWDVQRKVWDHLFGKELMKVRVQWVHSLQGGGSVLLVKKGGGRGRRRRVVGWRVESGSEST